MDITEEAGRKFMGDEAYEKQEAKIKLQENQFARLANARELDRSGSIKEAVYIYEQLVKEGCEHAQLYLRLTVIYRKQKQYDDEIRVMERAIQVWRDFEWGDLANKGEPMVTQYTERLEKAKALRAKAKKGQPA
jgi:tetratricopeptide (TPR) repeat protein